MENLHLLEKHRQKMWLFFALIVQFIIYIWIILFQTIYLYYDKKYNEDFILSDLFKELSLTIIILAIITPFLYAALAFLWCRIMHKIYRPIKDVIWNLEWFAENVNHEFKTSLTEIISTLDLAKVTKDFENTVDKVSESSKRLSRILDSLSFMIHFVNVDYRKEKLDVINFLDKSIEDYSNNIKEKELKIIKNYDTNKNINIFIDSAPLLLCFSNILKNAIRYSNNWWKIEISINKNYFIIKDYWIWISKENKEKIFDRHFRESYSWWWQWLWLSMVKKITQMYNWKIELESEKEEYTTIKLVFN